MTEFKKYKRTNLAEMRPYQVGEVLSSKVSISSEDLKNGSPKVGDMIARNPENHNDQWLVAKKYFQENFEVTDSIMNTDTARINTLGNFATGYGQGWICRYSVNGRGIRLHETSQDGAFPTIREAIDDFLNRKALESLSPRDLVP